MLTFYHITEGMGRFLVARTENFLYSIGLKKCEILVLFSAHIVRARRVLSIIYILVACGFRERTAAQRLFDQ